ncbi:MAG: DUF4139 domain-containing protein, partial [Archangium sp.]|nr:DUF4139 domain-containing protein [Archangium sp.]
FELPLGLDRAVKVARNVKVVDSTEGLISKDDKSTYVVTIDVVNPYRAPISVRVNDQWPLPPSRESKVSTALVESKPVAIQTALTGKLEWRLTLKPNEKQSVSFTYTVTRPRGWKLMQSEEVVP